MNSNVPPSHTVSYLAKRFAEMGIHPNTGQGQNFLIDQNLMRILVDAAELDPRDVVLEVGTGTGALTALLAQRAAAVITVELDDRLQSLIDQTLASYPNVLALRMDALKNKSNIAPEILDAVRKALASGPGRRFKLVANLPYQIATPIIGNLLACDVPPALMVVTIQKELGERICAEPSTKDYSALSVWVQSQCRAEIVRIMPPTVFWPRPKVESAIVKIAWDEERRGRLSDPAFLHALVRSLFLHRRKVLRGALPLFDKEKISKPDADRILEGLGHPANVRAEQLSVPQLIDLSDAVQRHLASYD